MSQRQSETSRCNVISVSLTNESPAALWCWQLPMKEFISPIGFPASPVTQLHISPPLVADTHLCTAKRHVSRNYMSHLRNLSTVPIPCSSLVLFNPSSTPHVGSLPLLLLCLSPILSSLLYSSHLRSTPSCVQVQGCWQTVSLSLLYLNTHTYTCSHSFVPAQEVPTL